MAVAVIVEEVGEPFALFNGLDFVAVVTISAGDVAIVSAVLCLGVVRHFPLLSRLHFGRSSCFGMIIVILSVFLVDRWNQINIKKEE